MSGKWWSWEVFCFGGLLSAVVMFAFDLFVHPASVSGNQHVGLLVAAWFIAWRAEKRGAR